MAENVSLGVGVLLCIFGAKTMASNTNRPRLNTIHIYVCTVYDKVTKSLGLGAVCCSVVFKGQQQEIEVLFLTFIFV